MTTGEEPTIPTMVKSDILYRASLRSIGLTTVPESMRMSVYPSALACATAACGIRSPLLPACSRDALSGEWEVPVTRNAEITPVNEGGGGGVGGPPPPGSPLARNAEIDPPPRLR